MLLNPCMLPACHPYYPLCVPSVLVYHICGHWLSWVSTYRPDESDEATIFYEDGVMDTIQLANPFNPEFAIKGIYNIASGSPICR